MLLSTFFVFFPVLLSTQADAAESSTDAITSHWQVDFFDDFETFNTDHWQDQLLWVNREDHCYVPDNQYHTREVSEGTLKLRVVNIGEERPCDNIDKTGKKHPDTRYVAGRIASKNRREFVQGKWTARLRTFDNGQAGMFPAFWLLGAQNNEPPVQEANETVCWPLPGSGEIDIFEHNGDGGPDHYVSRMIKNLGYCDGGDWESPQKIIAADLDQYHEYSVEWQGADLVYRLDGIEVHRNAGHGDDFSEPLFAILNYAKISDAPMQGEWVMEVDWVKHEYRSDLPDSTTEPRAAVICQWGQQPFNLCEYKTHDEMIEALLSEMSLDEKIGQMTQSIWHKNVSPDIVRQKGIGSIVHTEGPTPGDSALDWVEKFDDFQQQAMNTRLGIPLLIAVDAVHGQNTFDGAVIFPHNIGMAASRNMALIHRAAEITAREVAGTGFNWTYSPCIAMPQHEHWGRVYEGYTEDRDLTIAAVTASVRGHQGRSLSARHTIAATAKHYLGDGATKGGIEGGDAIMSDQTMRSWHLPPYATAVEEGVAAIMVGFNSYNGVNMHQNTYLVTDVLKGELGFEGVVVTDWNGGQKFGAAHTVINAGIDIAMQPGNHDAFMADLKSSVTDGTVAMSRIDDAVRRVLRLKFKLGLFNDPFAKREFVESVGSAEHRAVARQAVRESLVLLKNENNALPLQLTEKVAVIGAHGHNSGLQSGGWSIHWQGQSHSYRGATTILDAIKAVAGDTEYAERGCYPGMQAETAVVVVGEAPYAEMAGDTNQLTLSEEHKRLVRDCKNLGKKLVVVLISGRVLAIEPELALSDAFVAAWLPGSEGTGVADFLFGSNGFTPKGKSPYAWPAQVADLPLAMDDERALFKFGFGLEAY